MTASGNTRFEGERTRDGHADRFWAACAAIEAAATYTDPNRIFAQII
jgi:phage FluMu gp28-like protein